MPKGDKYINLENFLINSNQPIIKLSFDDIEKIIDSELPKTARNNGTWWANDTTSHSQSTAWLNASYKTDCVSDTYQEKYIVFIKTK